MVLAVAIILHSGGFPIIVLWNDLEPVALKRSDEGLHPGGVSLLQDGIPVSAYSLEVFTDLQGQLESFYSG